MEKESGIRFRRIMIGFSMFSIIVLVATFSLQGTNDGVVVSPIEMKSAALSNQYDCNWNENEISCVNGWEQSNMSH